MIKYFALKTLSLSFFALAGFFVSPQAQAQHRGDDEWVYCATEDGICRVNGRAEVAYGANGYYYYRIVEGSVLCSNRVFGDPIPGVQKQCFVRQQRRQEPPPGRGEPPHRGRWQFCAYEGEICRVPGPAVVRFGAEGYFNRLRIRRAIGCNVQNFGDPIRGVRKYCEFRLR